MKLPAWLEASNILVGAVDSLPAQFPRPTHIVAPRDETELEAWKTEEAARRPQLDSAVREWLNHDHWPPTLDATDGYLLTIRIAAARDWLDLGRIGVVKASSPVLILEALLIEGWADSFLEQHHRRLFWGLSAYSCGRESAGTFTE